MNVPSDDPGVALRKSVYTLLIVLGTSVVLGRILAVDSVDSEKLRAHLLRQIPRELEQKREELDGRNSNLAIARKIASSANWSGPKPDCGNGPE